MLLINLFLAYLSSHIKKYKYKISNKAIFNKISKIYYIELNINDNKQYYTSDYVKKIFMNFLDIKLVCNKYKKTFLLKFIFYKYFKSIYIINIIFVSIFVISNTISLV